MMTSGRPGGWGLGCLPNNLINTHPVLKISMSKAIQKQVVEEVERQTSESGVVVNAVSADSIRNSLRRNTYKLRVD